MNSEQDNSPGGTITGRRVVLVTNIPTPYRLPLFNRLHDLWGERGVHFSVVFAALGYSRRQWKVEMSDFHFPYTVLKPSRLFSWGQKQGSFIYPGLGRVLRAEKPDIVVTNGFSMATTRVWARRRFHGLPYVIWSGATTRKNRAESRWRRHHRRLLTRGAAGFVAYGNKSRDYLISLGANPEAVGIAINTVDTNFFREWGLKGKRTPEPTNGPRRLVYVGNLEPGKRLDLLIDAIGEVASTRNDFIVQIVGAGSQKAVLEQRVASMGLKERVVFEGFQQREAVAGILANATAFVFPSEYDIWGLVVNEAMAAGCPCLSSIHAGVTQDIVQDGVTGFALDFEQRSRVVDALTWVLDHPRQTAEMGARARAYMDEHVNIDSSARGFATAVESAAGWVTPDVTAGIGRELRLAQS